MKANAPEKLYIISDEDGVMLSLDNATDSRGDRYDFVDEAVFPFEDGTFEYTRTDAFIEKAVTYLEATLFNEVCYGEIRPDIVQAYIDDFKKAMKL